MDNRTKEIIVERLYESSSICSVCKKKKCPHGGNRELPRVLKTTDVLRAINMDEHFFREDKTVKLRDLVEISE